MEISGSWTSPSPSMRFRMTSTAVSSTSGSVPSGAVRITEIPPWRSRPSLGDRPSAIEQTNPSPGDQQNEQEAHPMRAHHSSVSIRSATARRSKRARPSTSWRVTDSSSASTTFPKSPPRRADLVADLDGGRQSLLLLEAPRAEDEGPGSRRSAPASRTGSTTREGIHLIGSYASHSSGAGGGPKSTAGPTKST